MPTLGQAIAFGGVLFHWNDLADAYCVSKYFLISLLCLVAISVRKPKRGMLSVSAVVYMVALMAFALLAFRQVCWVGKKLNYFTAVLPMSLVAISYHYSIGDKWEKIANAFIAACAIASIVSIHGAYLPQGDYFNGRVYAFIGSPVFLAGTLAMAVPLCIGRSYAQLAIPLIIAAIVFTQSRSGLVAASVGILGYCHAVGLVNWKGALILSGIALALSLGMFSNLRGTGKSDSGRYHMTRVALAAISEHPLGIGPERFGWALSKYRDKELNEAMGDRWANAYAHNSILEALLTGGPIFLLVYAFLIAVVGLFLYRHGPPAVYGAACALFAFGLMQPTPLLLKCVLGALAGSCDPFDREMPRARPWFIASALAAFLISLSAVTMAKIYANGQRYGLAEMMIDAFRHQPSAVGEQ